eukprot:TRINITY_DN5345_c0_g2_i5.p1 TRINITY_DN5345_c0_g2~~TRINITY_DN5345_c0_g2_i5.p1  ORF type:complete len:224 (+),score=39.87 TRINITY_DN5345_c0_g2_i5:65-736(+)
MCIRDRGFDNERVIEEKPSEINGWCYHLLPCDLRDLVALKVKLDDIKIDYKLPTLIFAECVLVYLEPKESDGVIQFFSDTFEFVSIMNYEMFNGNDSFGKVMVRNFEIKGCRLLGIKAFPDLPSERQRYESKGFQNIEVFDMLDMYTKYIDQTERKRIEKIEWFDEFEEWNLIQKHYFVSLATKLSPAIQEQISQKTEDGLKFAEIIAATKIEKKQKLLQYMV